MQIPHSVSNSCQDRVWFRTEQSKGPYQYRLTFFFSAINLLFHTIKGVYHLSVGKGLRCHGPGIEQAWSGDMYLCPRRHTEGV
jgi:succinate dehydrogenase/fumarate reductase cytochrome b subunit